MPSREQQLRDEREQLTTKLFSLDREVEVIRTRYGTDAGRMPAGQAQRYENLTRSMERTSRMIEETEAALTQRESALDEVRRGGGYTESGDGASRGDFGDPHRRTRRGDPWKSEDDSPSGWVSRAHSVLELVSGPDTVARNRLADLLDRGDRESGVLGNYLTRASHPDYLTAFLKVVRDPTHGRALFSDDENRAWASVYGDPYISRTAMSLTAGNGGVLVPMTLDPTVILTNSGIKSPLRQISRNVQIVTDDWNGASSAGVTAEWLTEGTQAADASPTFTQPTITPKKAAAWVFGSYEVMADSAFANDLSRLLADAKTRLELAAYATGNTGASQPRGVVAAVAAVTASIVSSATINSFVIGDVYRVSDAITPRASANVSWVASKAILNKIRQFDTTGGSAFWANLNMGVPPMLLGDPVYECSTMGSVITTSANILLAGDFQEFVIVDRIGMTILYEPMVKSTNANRPTGQAGWFGFWRTGSDVTNSDAFRLLQLHTTPGFTALG